MPFPRVQLDNFLRQAAQDIITILTDPPSTKNPTLESGYPVRNALLTFSTQLKRLDTIPQQKPSHEAAALRVKTPPLLKHTLLPAAALRVVPS